MERITDSNIKETIRLRNEEEAQCRQERIEEWVDDKIANLQTSDYFIEPLFVILIVLLGFLSYAVAGYGGVIMALIASGTIYFIFKVLARSEIKRQMQRVWESGQDEIRETYIEADLKTTQEIYSYENEVKQNSQRILDNPGTIQSMTDHAAEMFQRMVSHADSRTNIRFIETDFIYEVRKTGIIFYYPSEYTNPMDDYNFDKERYGDLDTDAECEGLAQALAELVIQEMTEFYNSNSLVITIEHNDAFFTLHFRDANKNFVNSVRLFE